MLRPGMPFAPTTVPMVAEEVEGSFHIPFPHEKFLLLLHRPPSLRNGRIPANRHHWGITYFSPTSRAVSGSGTSYSRSNYRLPGATPDTIAKTLAAPIEQEVNGVEDMLYMTSQSTADGAYSLTVTFKLGTDLDKAQVLVQNRVALAESRLPEAVRRIGVTVQKASPDLLLVVQMFSKDGTFDMGYISNYALLQVRERLRRIDGVGEVRLFGGREYSMRVWMNPERMDFYKLTAGEVIAALRCSEHPDRRWNNRPAAARQGCPLPGERYSSWTAFGKRASLKK